MPTEGLGCHNLHMFCSWDLLALWALVALSSPSLDPWLRNSNKKALRVLEDELGGGKRRKMCSSKFRLHFGKRPGDVARPGFAAFRSKKITNHEDLSLFQEDKWQIIDSKMLYVTLVQCLRTYERCVAMSGITCEPKVKLKTRRETRPFWPLALMTMPPFVKIYWSNTLTCWSDDSLMMERQIQELDVQTRSKIRSTQILASLPQIISELVQNSLDAGASQVDIGVNYEEWSCWVRDDGSGFRKDDLCALAGGFAVGRYSEWPRSYRSPVFWLTLKATSKAYNPTSLNDVSTFGFRGEGISDEDLIPSVF